MNRWIEFTGGVADGLAVMYRHDLPDEFVAWHDEYTHDKSVPGCDTVCTGTHVAVKDDPENVPPAGARLTVYRRVRNVRPVPVRQPRAVSVGAVRYDVVRERAEERVV